MKKSILFFALLFTLIINCSAQFTNLYEFEAYPSYTGHCTPVSDGSFLYGTTNYGGSANYGTIYKVNKDGSDYITLFNFNGIMTGKHPSGSLAFDGTGLYGMTTRGGSNNYGTIFKIMPDGTGYTKLFDFNDTTSGSQPYGSLIFDGTYLYGTTSSGGPSNTGTIFKIKPDGTGYSVILNFNGTNGAGPLGTLVSDGTFLYGTTSSSDPSYNGILFKIKPDGTAYSNIHSFNGNQRNSSALIFDGTFLYGMENYSFSNAYVFKIKPDGTDHTFLLSLPGNPQGSLISDGTFLYGTTETGGMHGSGTLFKVKTDGTSDSVVFNFDGSDVGGGPSSSLMSDSTFLYGITSAGGSENSGTLFKIKPDGTERSTLHDFTVIVSGTETVASLTSVGSFLYGMTVIGGSANVGTLFKIKSDGSGFSNLHSFGGSDLTDGKSPYGSLFSDGVFLYGITSTGGSGGFGTIFKIRPDGTGYRRIHDLSSVLEGYHPAGSLISDGTFLYGMAVYGGTGGFGTIFKLKPDGTEFSVIFSFDGTDGEWPNGSLFFDGSYLYGMTKGGAFWYDDGNIFKIKTDGTGFVKLHDFNVMEGGAFPLGDLVSDGIFLYGMTSADDYGQIFKIKKDGTMYSTMPEFVSSNSKSPKGSLIFDGTYLYGMTEKGDPEGSIGDGNMFKIKTDGTGYRDLYYFDPNISGIYPDGSLSSDGSFLYGMTQVGGGPDGAGAGAIFKFDGLSTCNSKYIPSYDSLLNTFTLDINPVTTAQAIRYQWDFGDGTSSNLATPTHVYTIDSAYNVCMKIYTATGDSCTYCRLIAKDSADSTSSPGFTINVHNASTIPFPSNCIANYTTTYDSTLNTFTLSVDSTTRSKAISYHWDFGDGNFSTLANPSHTYATNAIYDICMKIYNIDGDSCIYCNSLRGDTTLSGGFSVNVYNPDIPPSEPCLAHYTTVYDGISENFTLIVDSTTTAVATSYYWGFGDGTFSVLPVPSHTYAAMGSYNVCMKIYTASGDSCTYCHVLTGGAGFTINLPDAPPCIANYISVYDSASNNYTVTADPTTIALATSYHWDFGDGSTSALALPTHTFTTPGSYNVCLKIYTAGGDSCSYCQMFTGDAGFTINIPDTTVIPPCIAGYTTDYDSTLNTFILNVDSATTALATSYHWDFGDGSISTLATPSHIYTVDSLYDVCMKVVYADGDSCTYCHTIGIDSAGNIIRDGGFSLEVHNARTGVSENANQITITIYPNPTTGIFQLAMGNGQLTSAATLSIYNVVGEKIYVKDSKQLNASVTIDLSDQPNGIYFMQLKTEQNTITKKIIINK